MKDFFQEPGKRRVTRVMIAYLVISWLAPQDPATRTQGTLA